jgi:hypothetical protein
MSPLVKPPVPSGGFTSKKCLPELVKATSFRGQGEGVVGPH